MTVTTEAGVRSGTGDTDATTHQVALSFEDGVTRFITCREDQTVADASYRQRINIPLDCRDGACGTCKSFCESGDYDGGTYIDDALSDDESAQGYALPCCMKPRSDLVLQIPATSDIAKTQATRFTGTVVELDRLSESTVRLGIHIENRGQLAFLPGQYVNIEIPGSDDGRGNPVTRSYSFANGPHEDRLIFLIKLTPGGAMSSYLTDRAARGEPIAFTGPHGSFFLREADRPVLLLAGGTGLAPILSMLRKLHSDNSDRTVHLIYGVSTDVDLVAVDEIEWFVGKLPGFTWDHCVSDPASSAPNKGYVMSLIGPGHLNDGNVAIYLCGPPPMVESVRQHVTQDGIEPTGSTTRSSRSPRREPQTSPPARMRAARPAQRASATRLPTTSRRNLREHSPSTSRRTPTPSCSPRTHGRSPDRRRSRPRTSTHGRVPAPPRPRTPAGESQVNSSGPTRREPGPVTSIPIPSPQCRSPGHRLVR